MILFYMLDIMQISGTSSGSGDKDKSSTLSDCGFGVLQEKYMTRTVVLDDGT